MAGISITEAEKNDILRVVYILGVRLRWSDRRVGRVISHHHTTVSTWKSEAERKFRSKALAIEPESAGSVRLASIGNSSDVEKLEAVLNHRHGRVSTQNYKDEWDRDEGGNV